MQLFSERPCGLCYASENSDAVGLAQELAPKFETKQILAMAANWEALRGACRVSQWQYRVRYNNNPDKCTLKATKGMQQSFKIRNSVE
jgi:hypothetical protein